MAPIGHRLGQGMFSETPPEALSLSGELSIDPQTGTAVSVASSAPAPAAANIELPSADRRQSRRFRSSGDDHVLVSEVLAPVDGEFRYQWQIEDASGAVLGKTENVTSFSPFEVSGDILLFINPLQESRTSPRRIDQVRTLHGVDLNTGQEIWRREVRDTTYSGPLPH